MPSKHLINIILHNFTLGGFTLDPQVHLSSSVLEKHLKCLLLIIYLYSGDIYAHVRQCN